MINIDIKERKPSEIVQSNLDIFKNTLKVQGYDFNEDIAGLTLFEGAIIRIVQRLEENQCKCEAED